MTMFNRLLFGVLLVGSLTVLANGCGSSNPAGPHIASLSEVIGVWQATKIQVTDTSDSNKVADILAHGGRFVLTISSSGSSGYDDYALSLTFPGQNPATDNGQLTINGYALVTVSYTGSGETDYTYGFDGTTLTLTYYLTGTDGHHLTLYVALKRGSSAPVQVLDSRSNESHSLRASIRRLASGDFVNMPAIR